MLGQRSIEWTKLRIDEFFADKSRSLRETYDGLDEIIDHIHVLQECLMPDWKKLKKSSPLDGLF